MVGHQIFSLRWGFPASSAADFSSTAMDLTQGRTVDSTSLVIRCPLGRHWAFRNRSIYPSSRPYLRHRFQIFVHSLRYLSGRYGWAAVSTSAHSLKQADYLRPPVFGAVPSGRAARAGSHDQKFHGFKF